MTGFMTEPLPFVNNTITVFVEYNDSTHGTDTLSLVDPATSMTLDSIRFHSFRSLTVVFGGRTQNPSDADGDGSIGDLVAGQNREGIFDLAQKLYDSGWDVMAFNSTDGNIDNVVSVAEAEIKNAWDRRFIDPLENGTGFSIMGYSWGGGATHDLVERLYNDSYFPTYAVFVDAVDHGTNFQETDWPSETFYLLNIWQPNGAFELGGGAISNPEEMSPFSELEEIELQNEDHSSIDDDPFVHQRIETRLDELMLR
ncbi:MAG: hypothetical protein L0228_01520 [Planctomycetes bacterium]|nr:hypothetical protein [Planctomycetota bacterium]